MDEKYKINLRVLKSHFPDAESIISTFSCVQVGWRNEETNTYVKKEKRREHAHTNPFLTFHCSNYLTRYLSLLLLTGYTLGVWATLCREVIGEARDVLQRRHPQPEQPQRLHGRDHAGDRVRACPGRVRPLQEEQEQRDAVPLHGSAGGGGEHVCGARQPEAPVPKHTVSTLLKRYELSEEKVLKCVN